MDIEKSIGILKVFRNYNKFYKEENKDLTITITLETKESIDKAIERLLTAYEKEKEKNKELENDLKDMTKRYMEAESVKFWYNYIHKDKIRKMLQELEDRRNKQPVIGYWSKKAMLEKLLKEE